MRNDYLGGILDTVPPKDALQRARASNVALLCVVTSHLFDNNVGNLLTADKT